MLLGSGRKAVKHRRPSRSASGLSRKEVDGKGCGCSRDEGQGKKIDLARGGWAEDARRPPATVLCFRVDPSAARELGDVRAFTKSQRSLGRVSRGTTPHPLFLVRKVSSVHLGPRAFHCRAGGKSATRNS
jgi:hypothetical protein